MKRPDIHITIVSLFAAGLLSVVPAPGAADGPKNIRHAAVAGAFYPADSTELAQTVDELLASTPASNIEGKLVALISPHAGYEYSGSVAASGYRLLRGRDIRRVVIIAPSHLRAFPGAAVFDGDAYETPLGVVQVDKRFARELAGSHEVIQLAGNGHDWRDGYRGEHAVEVQLPFLQRVLGKFVLVPVVMGEQNYETCRALGRSLAGLIHDQGTLIIASSDLSHFHTYDEAVELDKRVTGAIERWDYFGLSQNLDDGNWEACGGGPIVATLIAAEQLGAGVSTVFKYANSGDMPAGDRQRVVGYVSAGLTNDGKGIRIGDTINIELTPSEKSRLLEISRRSVESAVRNGDTINIPEGTGVLSEELGAFVTLKIDGRLRGCIGYIVPNKTLQETVRDVAAFAAIRDRRFEPVGRDELKHLEYEISVLSPLRGVTNINQIKVGKHGLLIRRSQYQGLLLPQVATERGWDTITFLEQTCRKAGLGKDTWRDEATDIFAFTAIVFNERDLHGE